MTDLATRARAAAKRRVMIVTAISVACLAGLGAGVPAVLASVRALSLPGGSQPGVVATTGWPADKASRMESEDQLRQAAASRPLVAPSTPPAAAPGGLKRESAAGPAGGAATADAPAAMTAGILPLTSGGPFNASQFLGTNLWNGPVGGQWEVVQAGGVPVNRALGAASPTKAGLFVYTESADPSSTAAPAVVGVRTPAAGPPGMFTVRSAAGDVLTLTVSGSGKLYRFDLATRQFVQ
jgi:hypothetical protein